MTIILASDQSFQVDDSGSIAVRGCDLVPVVSIQNPGITVEESKF